VLSELTDGSHPGLARALGESGELKILEEALAKSVPGGVLSEREVSERASADARRRPSQRESDYEKRKLLTERVRRGVRRAAVGPSLPRSGFLEQAHVAATSKRHAFCARILRSQNARHFAAPLMRSVLRRLACGAAADAGVYLPHERDG